MRKMRSNRESNVWGSWMFSTTVDRSSHLDMRGFAAARMDVRALREQMIPALAMERVCCSFVGGRDGGREEGVRREEEGVRREEEGLRREEEGVTREEEGVRREEEGGRREE